MTQNLEFIDAETALTRLTPKGAVEALRSTLLTGFRPESDHQRLADPLANGEFLLMPAETTTAAGIKVLTVTPGNPVRDLPRIQGLYLLLDGDTHTPRAVIDGPALTDLRTPGVSFAAILDLLLDSSDPLDVALYGTGHQGIGHLRTLESVLEGRRRIQSVTAIVRSPGRAEDIDGISHCAVAGSDDAEAATAAAGLVICTTTAREPLFESDLIGSDAIVIAVGSHEPTARELPTELMGRATVIVEDIETALRECGDVVMAISDGALNADDLVPMFDVVNSPDSIKQGARPVVFKSSGMPWEDLAIAEAISSAKA